MEGGRSEVFTVKTGQYRENCHLLVNRATRKCLVVDPGAEPEKLSAVIRSESAKVEAILLTHGHFDHIGAVASLAKEFHAPVHCHQDELKLIRLAAFYAIRFHKERFETPRDILPFATCPALESGSFTIETLHTPGHTNGSVTYWIDGFLFTGDTLFHKAIGPTDYPESDPGLLRESVDRIMRMDWSASTVVCPGHGRLWDLGSARDWWRGLRGDAPRFKIREPVGNVGGKE